jgi:hypothetical protein
MSGGAVMPASGLLSRDVPLRYGLGYIESCDAKDVCTNA